MNTVKIGKVVGPPGPRGAAGSAGKSAYEYAVDGGYTGTEEEFQQLMGSIGTGGGVQLVRAYLDAYSWDVSQTDGSYHTIASFFSTWFGLDSLEDGNYLFVIDVQNEDYYYNLDEWNKHGVRAIGLDRNSLLFAADSLPSSPIYMRIYILKAEERW